MSETHQESGATTNEVGDGVSKVNEINAETVDQEQKTAKVDTSKDQERVLKDLHRFKSEAQERQRRIDELENSLRLREDQALAEKEDFKKLAETYKARWEESEKEKKSLGETFYETQKYDAVQKAALKSGLRPEAVSDLELLSYDGVVTERTDQGRVLIHGADDFVEQLKRTKPHWFQGNKAPKFNSGGASDMIVDSNKPITAQEVLRLERIFKRTQTDKDKAAYHAAHRKFAEQSKISQGG